MATAKQRANQAKRRRNHAETPSRHVPVAIRRQLRAEVGFGCPAPGCNSPYLEYHHFDPPWHIGHTHTADGIIPLCAEHHAKAEAWTPQQLREMKTTANATASTLVAGRFEWMRRDVIAAVGGGLHYGSNTVLRFRDHQLIWFTRDTHGHALFNMSLPTLRGVIQPIVIDNDWVLHDAADIECPVSGHRLQATFPDGRSLEVGFVEYPDADALTAKYPRAPVLFDHAQVPFPLLAVEANLTVGQTSITPKEMKFFFGTITGAISVGSTDASFTFDTI